MATQPVYIRQFIHMNVCWPAVYKDGMEKHTHNFGKRNEIKRIVQPVASSFSLYGFIVSGKKRVFLFFYALFIIIQRALIDILGKIRAKDQILLDMNHLLDRK